MTPEERFERIESLLYGMSVRENEIERRFNERMERGERDYEKAMKRMDRHEEKMRVAQEKAEERMAKFDKRLEAMRRLVEVGIKELAEMRRQQIVMQKNWDAYFASLKHPRNGNGRH